MDCICCFLYKLKWRSRHRATQGTLPSKPKVSSFSPFLNSRYHNPSTHVGRVQGNEYIHREQQQEQSAEQQLLILREQPVKMPVQEGRRPVDDYRAARREAKQAQQAYTSIEIKEGFTVIPPGGMEKVFQSPGGDIFHEAAYQNAHTEHHHRIFTETIEQQQNCDAPHTIDGEPRAL